MQRHRNAVTHESPMVAPVILLRRVGALGSVSRVTQSSTCFPHLRDVSQRECNAGPLCNSRTGSEKGANLQLPELETLLSLRGPAAGIFCATGQILIGSNEKSLDQTL